ncbi:MAG: response regulator [Spirochaetaceae bacterium]|jgi:response regulator RpfG family c-di-GMP phosphodiesterase|nr:response regulator [Spirochaetaceae bacterium]
MKTILAVDDVVTNLTTIRSILHEYYEVCLARTVEGALMVLERTKVDLILCDISMPGMDGFQFLNQIRLDPRYSEMPLIFITGHTSPDFVQKAINAGVNGYIIKPVNAEVLLNKVHDTLYEKQETIIKESPELDNLVRRLKDLTDFCETGKTTQIEALIRDLLKAPYPQQVTSNLNTIAKHIGEIDYPQAITNIKRLIKVLSPLKQPAK